MGSKTFASLPRQVGATDALSPRQREVFRFIAAGIDKGIAPTIREMCLHFNIGSPNGMMAHIVALEKKGYIVRDPMKARSIRLTEEGEQLAGSCDPLREAVGKLLSAEDCGTPSPVFRAALIELRKVYDGNRRS